MKEKQDNLEMMSKISAELGKLGVRDLGEREVKVVNKVSK